MYAIRSYYDPELGGVQALSGQQAVFGMNDAMPGGHEVDLSRPDDLFRNNFV